MFHLSIPADWSLTFGEIDRCSAALFHAQRPLAELCRHPFGICRNIGGAPSKMGGYVLVVAKEGVMGATVSTGRIW
jgi:hypothetical protein